MNVLDYKIKYGPTFMNFVGYSDASFPKAPIDDPKSLNGNFFMFCGWPISWKTHRLSTVSQYVIVTCAKNYLLEKTNLLH